MGATCSSSSHADSYSNGQQVDQIRSYKSFLSLAFDSSDDVESGDQNELDHQQLELIRTAPTGSGLRQKQQGLGLLSLISLRVNNRSVADRKQQKPERSRENGKEIVTQQPASGADAAANCYSNRGFSSKSQKTHEHEDVTTRDKDQDVIPFRLLDPSLLMNQSEEERELGVNLSDRLESMDREEAEDDAQQKSSSIMQIKNWILLFSCRNNHIMNQQHNNRVHDSNSNNTTNTSLMHIESKGGVKKKKHRSWNTSCNPSGPALFGSELLGRDDQEEETGLEWDDFELEESWNHTPL